VKRCLGNEAAKSVRLRLGMASEGKASMILAISRRRLLALSAMGLGLAVLRPGAALALDPAPSRIQAFYDVLLACMKQAKDLGVQGRFEKLAPAVRAAFDMPTMTKVACGPEWSKIPADKQQALVAAFERMTTANYASQFNDYGGQSFVVDPQATPRNADLIVHSQMTRPSGDPVVFNYLMRGSGEDWRIEDVYLDGTISQLAVRRSEFTAILGSEGADGLVTRLQNQSDGLLKSS
jgi:phospholipid transport system substrate-binding protein